MVVATFTFVLLPRIQRDDLAGFRSLELVSRSVIVALASLFVFALASRLQARPVACAVLASALIVVQAWVKRYIIVVPVFEHPYLPVQGSLSVAVYRPTWVELAITVGALAGFILVYYLFSRLFPIVSVWETRYEA